jgi:hypothetical protein
VTHLQTQAVLPLRLILYYGPIRSTQSLSHHGIAFASFSGKLVSVHTSYVFFVSLADRTTVNGICDVIPHLGPPKVLTDCLLSSVNTTRVSKVMVITFNYLFMFCFGYDNLFIVTYQLSHFACCMKWK